MFSRAGFPGTGAGAGLFPLSQAGRHRQGAGLAAGISPGGCAAPTGDGEQGTWLSHGLQAFAGAQHPPSSNGGWRARTQQRAGIPAAFLLPPPAWCPQSRSPWGPRGGQEAAHPGMTLLRVLPAPSPCCSVGLGAIPARQAAQGAGRDSSWDFSVQVGDLLPVPTLFPWCFPHKVLSGALFPHPCFCAPKLPTPSLGFILMTSGHASPSCPEGSAKSCHQLCQQLSTEAASLLPEPSAPSAPGSMAPAGCWQGKHPAGSYSTGPPACPQHFLPTHTPRLLPLPRGIVPSSPGVWADPEPAEQMGSGANSQEAMQIHAVFGGQGSRQ